MHALPGAPLPSVVLAEVHAAATAALRAAAAAVELEQAVRGIDSLGELALHALIADGLRAVGFGVHREVRYPADQARRRRSEGRRCDLVLTPDGRPLGVGADGGAAQLLLASLGAPAVALDEALWVEVKVVWQALEERPNRSWSASLQGPIWRDFHKLVADPGVAHAAQLVVLFTASDEIAAHDLRASLAAAARRGIHLDEPLSQSFAIGDRFGNARCTVALVQPRR